MASKDVQSRGTIDLAVKRVQDMVKDIETNYLSDDENAVANMAASILDAESFEDMFNASSLEPSEELFDTPLHIEMVQFRVSDYEGGIPFYVTLSGKKINDGTEFITNSGAWQVVVVAYKCLKNGWLPRNVMFHRQEKSTKGGFHPVNIFPWDENDPF